MAKRASKILTKRYKQETNKTRICKYVTYHTLITLSRVTVAVAKIHANIKAKVTCCAIICIVSIKKRLVLVMKFGGHECNLNDAFLR